MRDGLGLGMTDHFVGFRKYMLDTQKDIVTTTNVNVDISLIPNGKIYINSASNMAVANTLLDFTDQNTGKKYINHIVYNK
jgi:Fe-S cluster assembly iron-binding protein IscA